MLERILIEHGSPTLARLKMGSLMNVFHNGARALAREVQRINRLLAPKGVVLTVLRQESKRALLYLFRCGQLRERLRQEEAQGFLNGFGYESFSVAAALKTLRRRLAASGDFPHEIGFFLDYPLSDVRAFIHNEGRNCRLCGYWKVYSNEGDALRQFARFKKCRDVYVRLYEAGCPLARLTVATRAAS